MKKRSLVATVASALFLLAALAFVIFGVSFMPAQTAPGSLAAETASEATEFAEVRALVDDPPTNEDPYTNIIISFDTQGGPSLDPVTFSSGNSFRVPNLYRQGYELLHWVVVGWGAEFAPGVYMPPQSSDFVLLAEWEEQTYTIYFETECDLTLEPITSFFSEAVQVPFLVRPGYLLKKWTYIPFGLEIVPGNDVPLEHRSDVSLYAEWQQMPDVTLTFDTSGGKTISPQTFLYNSYAEVPTPSRDGYNFLGWQLNGVGYSGDVLTEDITLTAAWEPVATETPGKEEPEPQPEPTVELPTGEEIKESADNFLAPAWEFIETNAVWFCVGAGAVVLCVIVGVVAKVKK